MGISIKEQLKKYRKEGKGTDSYLSSINSWLRRDILVVTNKTEEIVDLFGDKVVVISENEYVPPVMKIGKVYAAAQVKLVNTAWWDDLRFRSVDKAINLL